MEGKSDPRHLDQRVSDLAEVQHGVVAVAQLLAIGLSRSQIAFRVRTGRLHAVEYGVYAVGHRLLTREGRWMAAVLSCGEGAVLSHRAAAAHWRILPPPSELIDVTVSRRSGLRKRERIRIHRVTSLLHDEHTLHDGIPITTVARTLVDVAAGGRRRTVERAVEESERRRLFDLAAVDAVLERHPRRPGAPLLRAVLAGYRDDHLRTRMELERLFLGLCEEHRIPRPEVNAFVGPYEVDLLWREAGLIAECDGWSTHATRAAFERDRARDAWLTARGYRVVRFTWRRALSVPGEVADLLRSLLAPASYT